jgi:hypothetical protein
LDRIRDFFASVWDVFEEFIINANWGGLEWTAGEFMFYGGIVGILTTLIACIVRFIVRRGGKRRIIRKLNEEYGG